MIRENKQDEWVASLFDSKVGFCDMARSSEGSTMVDTNPFQGFQVKTLTW
jgi:hypothetical protein